MAFLRSGSLLGFLILLLLIPAGVAQTVAEDAVFTLAVASPTQAKDVQVRYFFSGGFGGYGASSVELADGNKIRIKTEVEGRRAKSLKLIAYAPGCQLVLLTVDDLAAPRQGDFQCQKLPTIQLQGRVDVVDFGQRKLQVEALYDCAWAMSFFGIADGGVSPLSLGKVGVAPDGTFTLDVPDFANDPSWPRVSGDAGLKFALSDAATGSRLIMLTPLSEHSHYGDAVPVASGYPELLFVARPPQ